LNVIKRLADEVQLMFRRPEQTQYAALCYRYGTDGLEVLLLTSRDTGRWVMPKGWPMEGRQCHAVAEREAYEEAGVKGKADKQLYGTYHYQKGLKNGLSVVCKVQLYPLLVETMLNKFPEKGTRELAWVRCEEAASRVNEPELKQLLADFPHYTGLQAVKS
jgi:8-oxo-dGTP pyrophosphatase MutT (NUDIX family)